MRLLTTFLVLLGFCAGAFAMVRDNVPLSKDELATRVKLKREVLPCTAEGSTVIRQVTIKGMSKLTVSGADANGKPWQLVAESVNCQVWHGDMDGDGVEDFVFITGYSGSARALFVLFDADKRPVPWLAGGYLDYDADGIPELVDLDHDGHAELICMLPKKSGSGAQYWVTDLYEAKAGYWQQVRTPIAGRAFPLFTKENDKPRPVIPKEKMPFLADLTNVFSPPSIFVGLQRSDPAHCGLLRLPEATEQPGYLDPCHNWIHMADGRSCTPPGIVIFDNSSGRKVGAADILLQIQPNVAEIRTAGRASDLGPCTPVYMWVTEP